MLNNAVIMGRLTADPELRTTGSDVSVTRFTVAVDRSYQRQGEEKVTDFIDVVAWRRTAEFVTRYFHKGSMIAVQGSIQTGSYEDRNGVKRRTFEIVANEVSFCGSKSESGGGYNPGRAAEGSGSEQQAPAAGYSNADNGEFVTIDDNEDLPF